MVEVWNLWVIYNLKVLDMEKQRPFVIKGKIATEKDVGR